MKLILKKDVQSLGEVGDIVEVADGFARNFLLPQSLGEIATKGAIQNREKNIARIKAKAEKLHQEALAQAETIKALGELALEAKAGESGKLFGAITTKKLAELLNEKTGLVIDRRNISLSSPINKIGEYNMSIKLTSKVKVDLTVIAQASEIIRESISEAEEQIEE